MKILHITATPVVKSWGESAEENTNGSELQRLILRAFPEGPLPYQKTFTFKDHGAFFRGASLMASLRYVHDFYDLLQQYGTLQVTITAEDKDKP